MAHKIAGYGWKKDHLDPRDIPFSSRFAITPPTVLPPAVDLRPQFFPAYDQNGWGSCTANAIAAAFDFTLVKEGLQPLGCPSRMFIYYCERDMEGSTNSDSGAEIRDGIKVVASTGVCKESLWDYEQAHLLTKPTQECYDQAKLNLAVQYLSLNSSNLAELQTCLAQGYPIIFGMLVYPEFESSDVARTGVVNLPNQTEASIGGHAVLIVGYDDLSRRFIVRNSWGTNWGLAGYFTIPYVYVTNPLLCSDFWSLRVVKETVDAKG